MPVSVTVLADSPWIDTTTPARPAYADPGSCSMTFQSSGGSCRTTFSADLPGKKVPRRHSPPNAVSEVDTNGGSEGDPTRSASREPKSPANPVAAASRSAAAPVSSQPHRLRFAGFSCEGALFSSCCLSPPGTRPLGIETKTQAGPSRPCWRADDSRRNDAWAAACIDCSTNGLRGDGQQPVSTITTGQ